MPKVVAVIPAYHEASCVAKAVRDALQYVDAAVVVDDCSLDSTSAEAFSAGAYVLRHLINRGQGAALQTGTDYALESLGADIIVHFDADGQMKGEEIPQLIQPIIDDEVDIVLGSRFLGKKPEKMPLSRKIVNRGGLLFTLFISGLRLTDTHNGFRALSKEAAKKLRISLDRMAHASEILDLIKVKHLRYVERPVTIRYSAETLAKSPSSMRAVAIVKDILKKRIIG